MKQKLKRKILMLFGVIFAFLMIGAAFATTFWSDNFNDNSLNGRYTVVMHGYGWLVERNQRIEMSPYLHIEGEDWMSIGLRLPNNNDIPFSVGTHVIVYVPYYWDVQKVNLVVTNDIYSPMSAHRRYTISWTNNWVDGTGTIRLYKQVGANPSLVYVCDWHFWEGYYYNQGHWGIPYWSPTRQPYNQPFPAWLGFAILREGTNSVSFWWGEYYNWASKDVRAPPGSYWKWQKMGYENLPYIFSNNYPNYIFDTYNSHPDHELGYSAWDDFYIGT